MEEIELNQEQIEKLIAAGVIEEIQEQEEDHEDLSPKISMKVEDTEEEFELSAFKLPVLQISSSSTGPVIVEVYVKKGHSSYFKKWLESSEYKAVEIVIADHQGEKLETWKAKCLPDAIAWGEMSSKGRDPWTISIQFSSRTLRVL